jgi:hypothetical protein
VNRSAAFLAAAALLAAGARAGDGPWGGAPARLSETGLYSDAASGALAPGVLAYEPQYPLWTDGARKQRWIRLPAGTSIDAADPDVWSFPAGTRLWKEFAFERRVETRMLERRADGGWNYATYVWSADGSDAALAPERGLRGACESAPGVRFDVPGRSDCRACHEGGPNRVLGFSALQLSSDRDPLAPHAQTPPPGAVDLAALVGRGLVRNLPADLAARPPRIVAATPRERAALGYLHANCGGCHASGGALANLGLALDYRLARRAGSPSALQSALDVPSRFHLPGAGEQPRLAPGDPGASVLLARMASRNPLVQMPPLGTRAADVQALQLVAAWIREDLVRADAARR